MTGFGGVLTELEADRVAVALVLLGFSRASLLVGSDRANRYFAVPAEELESVGQSAGRRIIEPLFPGAKAKFMAESAAMTLIPISLVGGTQR